MDIFTQFNRKSIQDRQIDTLIGLSTGIIADGRVDQAEAEVLQNWLAQASQQTDNPIIINLLEKVSAMLEDNILDDDEASELFSTLETLSGGTTKFGEISKPSSLPLDSPTPKITFEDKHFLFTGTCAFGTRKQCQDEISKLNGIAVSSVTKKLDYLVIGSYVTDSWIHETFGRKIEKAMEYRESGLSLKIVSEEEWAKSMEL